MTVRTFLSGFDGSERVVVHTGNGSFWGGSAKMISEIIGDLYVIKTDNAPNGAIGLYVS